jgi:hypothetical protein
MAVGIVLVTVAIGVCEVVELGGEENVLLTAVLGRVFDGADAIEVCPHAHFNLLCVQFALELCKLTFNIFDFHLIIFNLFICQYSFDTFFLQFCL